MSASDHPASFWDAAATAKKFTHPLDAVRLREWLEPGSRILDFGCGQGRLCVELDALGYAQVVGVDSSPEMIARARASCPRYELLVSDGRALPFADASFDAVLLFAVLTCIPDGAAQKNLVASLKRVLRPGGLLLVSDYPLQEDARNRERYQHFAGELEPFGTFRLPGGPVLRHHAREWFDELLAEFELRHREERDVLTMNGNPARVLQIWAENPH